MSFVKRWTVRKLVSILLVLTSMSYTFIFSTEIQLNTCRTCNSSKPGGTSHLVTFSVLLFLNFPKFVNFLLDNPPPLRHSCVVPLLPGATRLPGVSVSPTDHTWHFCPDAPRFVHLAPSPALFATFFPTLPPCREGLAGV